MAEETNPYVLKHGGHFMREKTGGIKRYGVGDTVHLTEKQANAIKDKIDWPRSRPAEEVAEEEEPKKEGEKAPEKEPAKAEAKKT